MSQSTEIDRPLTVLQMVPELEEGGVECETVEMAEHLVRHGHNRITSYNVCYTKLLRHRHTAGTGPKHG